MRKEKKEGGERDRKWKMAKSQDNALEFKINLVRYKTKAAHKI